MKSIYSYNGLLDLYLTKLEDHHDHNNMIVCEELSEASSGFESRIRTN